MPQTVVHQLETVQIQKKQREVAAGLFLVAFKESLQPVEHGEAVGQTAQRIGQFSGRDIGLGTRDAQCPAVRVSHRGATGRDPPPRAVGMADPVLVFEQTGSGCRVGIEFLFERRRIVGMNPR